MAKITSSCERRIEGQKGGDGAFEKDRLKRLDWKLLQTERKAARTALKEDSKRNRKEERKRERKKKYGRRKEREKKRIMKEER